jgi:hypothetical protein
MILKVLQSLIEFLRYSASVMYCMRDSQLLKPNAMHRGEASGEVYILCTGASLKGKDLSWLAGKDIIATNLFCLSDKYNQLDIKHYSIIEPWNYRNLTFLSFFTDLIMLRRKSGSQPTLWLHASAHHYINKKSLHYDDFSESLLRALNVRLVASRGDFASDSEVRDDLSEVSNVAMGATFFNVFLAMYLGYKRIYLLGADYNKSPMQIGHLYDNWQQILSVNELTKIAGFDVHGLTMKRNLKMIDFAEAKNISIINVIDRGFESLQFESVYYDELARESDLHAIATK